MYIYIYTHISIDKLLELEHTDVDVFAAWIHRLVVVVHGAVNASSLVLKENTVHVHLCMYIYI